MSQAPHDLPCRHLVLTAFHLQAALGPAIFAFPALIASSCVYTKQHYLVDLPAGACVGWACFLLFHLFF